MSASTTSGHKDDLPTILVVQPVRRAGRRQPGRDAQGPATPVVLSLALGQKTIDARKEFKLPWPGPNAATAYHAASPTGIDAALLDVLNGLPPSAAAIRVQIGGVEPDAMAWRDGDALYLRTVAGTVQPPKYRQQASQPSGLHAYQLPDVPVLLMRLPMARWPKPWSRGENDGDSLNNQQALGAGLGLVAVRVATL